MRSTAVLFSLFLLVTGCTRPILRGDGSAYAETRPLASFNKLQIWGNMEIVLVKGDSCSIRIEGEKNIVDLLRTEVSSNDLHVHLPLLKDIRPTQRLRCRITVPHISKLNNSGSGSIQSMDTIRTDQLSIHNSGSGRIEIGVGANRLRIGVSGSGRVIVAGQTGELHCRISGSGAVDGTALAVREHAAIRISGSGTATISTNGVISGGVSGSGNINYKGDPSSVRVRHSGSGRARKVS